MIKERKTELVPGGKYTILYMLNNGRYPLSFNRLHLYTLTPTLLVNN